MRALLEETFGITDSIVRCLQAAALVAIRERRERITIDLLSWWRDPPLLTHYESANDELAAAWLADANRRADPFLPAPHAGPRNRTQLSSLGRL